MKRQEANLLYTVAEHKVGGWPFEITWAPVGTHRDSEIKGIQSSFSVGDTMGAETLSPAETADEELDVGKATSADSSLVQAPNFCSCLVRWSCLQQINWWKFPLI